MSRSGILVLFALLLVGVGSILADEQSDAPEAQGRETVEGPPTDDIRLGSTSGTVTGSLQGKEGMRIQTLCTHCNSANIQVGGLAQEFAPISVNGYAVIGGLSTSILLSIMPSDTIAGAKVLKGPGRPTEPSTSAGGHILLEEARPVDLPMIDVSLEAGAYDRHRGTFRVAGELAPWVSGSFVVVEEEADAVDDDRDGNNDVGTVDRTFAEGRLDFSIGRDHTLDVGASWIEEEDLFGRGPFAWTDYSPFSPGGGGEISWDREDSIFDQEQYRAGWEWRLGDGHNLEVRALESTRNLALRSGVPDIPDILFNRFEVLEENKWATARYSHTVNFQGRLEVGVEARDQRVSARTMSGVDVGSYLQLKQFFKDIGIDPGPLQQPYVTPGTDSAMTWSAFAGYDWTPSSKWGLHAGLRYDDAEWKAEIFSEEVGCFNLDGSPSNAPGCWSTETRTDSALSPRATLRYTPVSDWTFKLVAGGTFRAPRPILAEICCGQEYQRTVGTAAETGRSFGLEAIYQPSPRLRTSAYLASTEFEDHFLRMVGWSRLFIQTYLLGNISQTRADTAEFLVRWSPTQLVTLDGSIGWLSHQNTGDRNVSLPFAAGLNAAVQCTDMQAAAGDCEQIEVPIDRVPYQPERTGSLAVNFSLPQALSLSVQASYTGSMLIQQFGDSSVLGDGNHLSPDLRPTASFWLVNFSFEMPVGRQIELVGGVDNLTDFLQDDLGDPTTDFNWGPLAGRSWRMGVRYRYR